MKFKSLKVIAMSMALALAMPMNVFATPISLANSTESVATDTLDKVNGTDYFVDETTNVWQDGSIVEEARVTVSRTSEFEVTIPKEVVLDGSTGTADYKVKVKGDIAGDQKITVTPDTSFTLSEAGGKTDVTATVTQPDTEYIYTDLQGEGTEYDGKISATLTAGEWSGKFSFNINFKASLGLVLPAKVAFNDMSWTDIATVSEVGKAPEYFTVGDEKELQIGDETYHVQILGFDHDDKSDGTGKAGITVGLKEVMTTTHVMNSEMTNVGGWETSEMRTYINEDIYRLLPQEVKNIIKPVDKLTSEGNTSTNIVTTSDNLFLLSEIEIFGSTKYSANGEGSRYQYFINGGSKIKYKLDSSYYWWERSPRISNASGFCNVSRNGDAGNGNASNTNGVVFGFSI